MNGRRVNQEVGDAKSSDERIGVQAAVELVDARVREFIAAMASAGNPGARRHDLVGPTPQGWAFTFDPTTGGATSRVVIDTHGFIYARSRPPSRRGLRKAVTSWLFDTASPIEPMYRALALSHELDEIETANGVHAT
jgi:hypothetical protein